MLKRKAMNLLEEWFRTRTKQALLVTGARQVGKTYLIRKFAASHWENVIEINFYENTEAKVAIESATNSSELFMRLTAFTNTPLVPHKTVFFLDEIQECKEAVTAIKFLMERKDYDYILSSSMLGTELKGIRSAPVGYLNTVFMYPLDFEEFCWANGIAQELIDHAKESFYRRTELDEFVHSRFLDLFHRYLICGGMPDVVLSFLASNDVSKARTAQEAIVGQYRWDISKYAGSHARVVRRIFDLMPSEISAQDKRFVISDEIPKFKLFSSDVGILTYQCGLNVVREVLGNRPDINFGAIYENAVAQELKAHGHQLYYFKKRNIGEIDFVVQTEEGQVIPLEVKSGKGYTKHSALNHVLETKNYGIKEAFVLCESNIKVDRNIIYLPVYLITFI